MEVQGEGEFMLQNVGSSAVLPLFDENVMFILAAIMTTGKIITGICSDP